MTTFDRILPLTAEVLAADRSALERLNWLLINRDLNAKVRLVAPEGAEVDESLRSLLNKLAAQLGRHAHPPESAILFEASREAACHDAAAHQLEGFDRFCVVLTMANAPVASAICLRHREGTSASTPFGMIFRKLQIR